MRIKSYSFLCSKKKSNGFNRKTIVQLDPYATRDSSWRRDETVGSDPSGWGPDSANLSVMKSAKNCLQLNRSFRQTIPQRFVAK